MKFDSRNLQKWRQQLADAVAARYRTAGCFACHFARNKIRFDPLVTDVLRAGIAEGRRGERLDLLDLGCGQGLLPIALELAPQLCLQGAMPVQGPGDRIELLQLGDYCGIECSAANVARAMSAFATIDPQRHRLRCIQGDILVTPYPMADIVALIDVLHYLNYPQQEQVLLRARSALMEKGTLLLRVGNADARYSNRLSQAIDGMVSRLRGVSSQRIYCRGLAQWLQLLESLGLAPRVASNVSSMFFSNVMIVAKLR